MGLRNKCRRLLFSARGRIAQVAIGSYERLLGITTAGELKAPEYGYAHGIYRPTSWLVLRELFRSLDVDENDTFVDVGSGMGRVVLMAARRPFRRIIGVERSEEFNEVARSNIARNRHRLLCDDIEFLSVDAQQWEVPDDVTVVYLYCPFPSPIFERLVENLIASIDRAPRHVRVIYTFSTREDRDVLLRTGQAQPISFKVPRYVRSRFEEVSMFRLLPSGWDG